MRCTKLKLTLLGLVLFAGIAATWLATGVRELALWGPWMGGVVTLITQYTAGNAAITKTAIRQGNGHAAPPAG